jgi:hypothetical protein
MRKATGIAGAIAAGAILTSAALAAGVSPFQLAAPSVTTPTQSTQINRTNKADSLPAVFAGTQVQRTPAETVRPILSPTSPGDGCESSVTAHTGPADLARVPSRCVTQLPSKNNVAALN